MKSLDEGFEETLTLHRLGLFEELGTSFKTTNLVENVNGLLERYTGRVTRWRNSAAAAVGRDGALGDRTAATEDQGVPTLPALKAA